MTPGDWGVLVHGQDRDDLADQLVHLVGHSARPAPPHGCINSRHCTCILAFLGTACHRNTCQPSVAVTTCWSRTVAVPGSASRSAPRYGPLMPRIGTAA